MKLVINGFENEIKFSEEYVNVIQVKNKKLFQNIMEQIYLNTEGNSDNLKIQLFSSDDEKLDFKDNVYLLTDLYNIDVNNKKMLTKIQEMILKNFNLESAEKIDENILKIKSLLLEEINEFPLELSVKEGISLNDIVKMFNIKIETSNFIDIVRRIESVIDILANLKLASILIIPNLKSYLNNKQTIEIYKYSLYNKINLLIVETNKVRKNKFERILVIDKQFNDYFI